MNTISDTQASSWTDALGRPILCIRRDQRQLVGISHTNKLGQSRLDLVSTLECGTSLTLVPEPDNRFDRNAILVYRTDTPGSDIGYMDATGAKQFCKLIERGSTFSAEVSLIDRRASYPQVYFYIFQLTEPTVPKRPSRRNAAQYKGHTASKRRVANPIVQPAFTDSNKADERSTTKGFWQRLLSTLFRSR